MAFVEKAKLLRERWGSFWADPDRLGWAWMAFMFIALAPVKWKLNKFEWNRGCDGGFYTNIAQHVRDGNGLMTNISLYHQGYPELPYPTSVYPIWPLVYGYASRVVDIHTVAVWLPTFFYVLTIVLAYVYGKRLFPGQLFENRLPGINSGHVLAFIFAANYHFFWVTSSPHTEALAYFLLHLSMLRLMVFWGSPTWLRGIEVGVWLALVSLTRSQLFIEFLAVICTFAFGILFSKDRKKLILPLGSVVAAFALVIYPYFHYVSQNVMEPGLFTFMRFDQARATDTLSKMSMYIKPEGGLWGYLKDRATGIPVAFSWESKYSYRKLYDTLHLAIPAAIPFLFVAGARIWKGMGPRAAFNWLRAPENRNYVFFMAFAMAGLLSIHTVHKHFGKEWHFNYRHALTVAYIIFAALVFLLKRPGVIGPVIAVLLIMGSGFDGYTAFMWRADKAQRTLKANPYPDLVRWINKTTEEEGELTVAITQADPQRVAPYTPGVNYHWTYARTTPEDLDKIFTVFGAKYYIMRNPYRKWQARTKNDKFNDLFRRVNVRIRGFTVYGLRDHMEKMAKLQESKGKKVGDTLMPASDNVRPEGAEDDETIVERDDDDDSAIEQDDDDGNE